MSDHEIEQLRLEHEALMLSYREVQIRCSAQIQSLTQQVQSLSQQLLRTRAQLIARDSALAWEREQRSALAAQQLQAWLAEPSASLQAHSPMKLAVSPSSREEDLLELQLLENSLQAADLVICQSGCISDGAFWRVKDHCKRTGKPCVLLDPSPHSLRVVHLHAHMPESEFSTSDKQQETTPSQIE